MKVKIITGLTALNLEYAINEFLDNNPNGLLKDIKILTTGSEVIALILYKTP